MNRKILFNFLLTTIVTIGIYFSFFAMTKNMPDCYLENFANSLVDQKAKDKTIGSNTFAKINNGSYVYNNYIDFLDYSSCVSDIFVKADGTALFEDTNVSLITQQFHEITQNEYSGDRYYLSGGHFFTYYGSSLAPYFNNNQRWYLNARNGANSFIFISDTLADLLIQKYQIKSAEPYKELILNNLYNKITFDINDDAGNKSLVSFSINDIIDTTKRYGVKAKKHYKYFADIYYKVLEEKTTFSCNMEFKNETSSIKTAIKKIDSISNSWKDTQISFYKVENGNEIMLNDSLDMFNSYVSSSFNNTVPLFLFILSILEVISIFVINKFLSIDKKTKKLIFYAALFLFLLIFSIIVNLCFKFYYLNSIAIVLSLISILICFCGQRGFRVNV